MKVKETFYTSDRNEWRKWLSENFETKFIGIIPKYDSPKNITIRPHTMFTAVS